MDSEYSGAVSREPRATTVGDIMGTSGLTHREDYRRMTASQRKEADAKRAAAMAGRESDETFGQHLSEHAGQVTGTETLA